MKAGPKYRWMYVPKGDVEMIGTYEDFLIDLGLMESGGNYACDTNPPYLGMYQIGPDALRDIEISSN